MKCWARLKGGHCTLRQPTLSALGVFLQTSCFGPDGHVATGKALLGSFQLGTFWFEAPPEGPTRTFSAQGSKATGTGAKSWESNLRPSWAAFASTLPRLESQREEKKGQAS